MLAISSRSQISKTSSSQIGMPSSSDPRRSTTARSIIEPTWIKVSWFAGTRPSGRSSVKVDFVGLDTQDERSAELAFAKSTNVHYPLAFETAQVWSSYGVYGLPTTFFISPDVRILGEQVGGLTKSRLLALIHEVFKVTVTSK